MKATMMKRAIAMSIVAVFMISATVVAIPLEVLAEADPYGFQGYVKDAKTGAAIPDALVVCNNGQQDYTDSSGWYSVACYDYNYHTLTVSKSTYATKIKTSCALSPRTGVGRSDFSLDHNIGIWGYTKDETGAVIPNVVITFVNEPQMTTQSNGNGYFWAGYAGMQPWGDYSYYANAGAANHYQIYHQRIVMPPNTLVQQNLVLENNKLVKIPVFAMFCTQGGSTDQLTLTTRQVVSQTITAYFGAGYGPGSFGIQGSMTVRSDFTASQTGPNVKSLVYTRGYIVSGYYGWLSNETNGVQCEYVQTITNNYYIDWYKDDYLQASDVNVNNYASTRAGIFHGYSNGQGTTISGSDSSSVTLNGNLGLGVSAYGLTIGLGVSLSSTNEESNSFTIAINNPTSTPKAYKWYFEANNPAANGGMILHVWEVPNDTTS